MNATRKLPWISLLVGVVIGCGSEEMSTPPGNTPPPGGLPPVAAPNAEVAPVKKTPEPMLPPPSKADEEKKPATAKKDEPPAIEGPKSDAGKPKAITLTQEEIANIKKLPAAEQDAALKQMVCPVSDGPLGSMGMPRIASISGRTFFLCCGSCQDTVKADPKSVLAKLDKK